MIARQTPNRVFKLVGGDALCAAKVAAREVGGFADIEDMDRVGNDVEVVSLSTPNIFFADAQHQLEIARIGVLRNRVGAPNPGPVPVLRP